MLQIAGLLLLYFHHSALRVYVGIALGIFLIDRLAYRLSVKSRTFIADAQIMPDLETVRLSTDVVFDETGFWNTWISRGVNNGWKATDHVYLSCPTIRSLQAHPFTIASPAPTNSEGINLELLIRAQDGFSAELVKEAAIRSSLKMRLDGPYGGAHARHLLDKSDVAILVAGGSGIAVCWPLVHHLLNAQSADPEQATLRATCRIFLIWVVHKSSHLEWIGQERSNQITKKGVEVIIPPATAEVGRPDLELYIGDLVARIGQDERIGVVGSGPDSMGRTVRNTVSRLVGRGRKVDVTIEKFGW